MKKQVQKPAGSRDLTPGLNKKVITRGIHPIQLQQILGNKTVTKMIQRHPDEFTLENNARIEHNSGQIFSLQSEVAGLRSSGGGGGGTEDVVVPAAGGF